jgi:Spy/CpxP family protein refolding chaperone
MKSTLFTVLMLVALTLMWHQAGVAAADGEAGAADQQKGTKPKETAPAIEGTSPARPDIPMPRFDDPWYCWRCGSANPYPKKHFKERLHRPMLAPGIDREKDASRSYGKDGMMRGAASAHALLRHAVALGLEREQAVNLSDLAYRTEKTLIDLRAKMQREELELKRAVLADDVNLSSLKRHLDAAARARVNFRYAQLESWIEAKNLLTEEQRHRLRSMQPGVEPMIE